MAESGLIEYVKDVVTKQAADLDPDGDVPPCLVYINSTGSGVVLLLSFDSPEEKDEMALLMMASLMVDDAREAVFVSCVWTVSVAVRNEAMEERLRRGWDGPMPEQHPDRVEQIMLAHCTVEDDDFHFAEIIRRPDAPPSFGDWDDTDLKGVGGRFADAVHDGLLLAKVVPPALRAKLDGACADPDERDTAIRGFMAALRKKVNH